MHNNNGRSINGLIKAYIQTGERNIFLPEVIGVPSLSHWKVRAALREEGMLAMHVS